MCDDIAILKKERNKLVDQITRLNAEIEEAEGKRAILRFRAAELSGEIEETEEDEAQVALEETEEFQKLLEGNDASTLRTKFRSLNDKIDKSRSPDRNCSNWEARVQRRAVATRLETIEQEGVTR